MKLSNFWQNNFLTMQHMETTHNMHFTFGFVRILGEWCEIWDDNLKKFWSEHFLAHAEMKMLYKITYNCFHNCGSAEPKNYVIIPQSFNKFFQQKFFIKIKCLYKNYQLFNANINQLNFYFHLLYTEHKWLK